jgi:hypothetical protein
VVLDIFLVAPSQSGVAGRRELVSDRIACRGLALFVGLAVAGLVLDKELMACL